MTNTTISPENVFANTVFVYENEVHTARRQSIRGQRSYEVHTDRGIFTIPAFVPLLRLRP